MKIITQFYSIHDALNYMESKQDKECFDFLETLNNHEINLIKDHIYNEVFRISELFNKLSGLILNDFDDCLWEQLDINLSKFGSFDNVVIKNKAPIEDFEIRGFKESQFLNFIDLLKKLYRVVELIKSFNKKEKNQSDSDLKSREPVAPNFEQYSNLQNQLYEVTELIKSFNEKDNSQSDIDLKSKKQYPDKWYAFYHALMIALGKENPFPNSFTKKEIVKYGQEKYNTKGEGFYKEFGKIDFKKTYTLIQSFSQKDRKIWKKVLKDISNNNADVIAWIDRQPN